jgi:hypothetical protein
MSTVNFAVARRHYCEEYTTPPHAYFSGKIPLTTYIVDEITIEITEKTKDVVIDYTYPEGNKIIQIRVRQNEQLLDHEVLATRLQKIDPNKLEWMNLGGKMNEMIYPVRIRLNKEYGVGERVQLTIEMTTTFRIIPERKDFFLPSIEFEHVASFLDEKYWPKKMNVADSSISYVLPKGFNAVSMTSQGPDFISERDGDSFVGWIFRGETNEHLRHWFAAQMSIPYFLLLYLVIPLSGLLAIAAKCFQISVPSTIIAMLCAAYFAARYYLYDKTLMSPGGDLIILITFITVFVSVFGDFGLTLLVINLFAVSFPWIASYFRFRDTKRNRKKNDQLLGKAI